MDTTLGDKLNNLVNPIKEMGDNVRNEVNNLKEKAEGVAENVKSKADAVVPNQVKETVNNAVEKAKSGPPPMPKSLPSIPLLNKMDSFRRNVVKVALTIFVVLFVMVFIFLKHSSAMFDYFKYREKCPEGWTPDNDGNCEKAGKTFDPSNTLKNIFSSHGQDICEWDGVCNNKQLLKEHGVECGSSCS